VEPAAIDLSRTTARTDVLPLPPAVAADHAQKRRWAGAAEFAWLRACLTVDVLMIVGGVATSELGAAQAGVPQTPQPWLSLSVGLVLVMLWGRRLYAPRLGLRPFDDVRAIVVSCAFAAMAVVMLRGLVAGDPAAADQGLRLAAFSAVYLIGGRTLLTWSELTARRRGETLRPTLIIGAGHVGRLAAKRLLAHPELGLRPIGFLDKDPLAAQDADVTLPVLGASWDIEDVVREHGVEQVIVTFSKAPHEVLLRISRRCEELGVRIAFVPRLFDRMTERISVEHVGGLPLLTAGLTNPKGTQFAFKHAVDRVAAALLLFLLLPVLAGVAVAVAVSLGRPIFFRQTRVGRDDRLFEMLKFRTMRPGHDEALPLLPDTAPGGVEGGDRRTRVGELLRKSSVDELPQLLNVLRGEMSLVGPRPERPEFVDLFGDSVYRYDDRHRVKSGITGWAQVNGLRGKTSISERAELDNYYVQNWSLWLDVQIVLRTWLTVMRSYRNVE
jgi:exopolysaccharide biosynthesis polyprenyl glycosylphosphotransferase